MRRARRSRLSSPPSLSRGGGGPGDRSPAADATGLSRWALVARGPASAKRLAAFGAHHDRIEILAAEIVSVHQRAPAPTRHVAHHCTWFECRRYNRLLLLDAPRVTPLGTGQYLDACHCTVSCTSANTAVCTGAYQPNQLEERKTAFGGGLQRGCKPLTPTNRAQRGMQGITVGFRLTDEDQYLTEMRCLTSSLSSGRLATVVAMTGERRYFLSVMEKA